MKSFEIFRCCSNYFNTVSPRFMVPYLMQYRCCSFEKIEFSEKSVQIKTCGELYKKWKKENVFQRLPDGDLTFDVKYIDTRPDSLIKQDIRAGTVLALHGAPGSWKDFRVLSSYLHQRGHRVIAPSFPDFYDYKPGIFKHSNLEKAQYIKDFLLEICVPHIDLLICHSGAGYPGLNLCLDNELTIKSLAILNPVAFDLKYAFGGKYYPWLKFFSRAIENPIGLKIMDVFGSFIMKNILKVPVRFENVLDPMLSVTTIVNAGLTEAKENIVRVSEKLPILITFSENDPLISAKASYELAEVIGACSSDIFIYNNQGNLVQKGATSSAYKILVFQEGSHYSFLKYPEIINKEINDFLELHKE